MQAVPIAKALQAVPVAKSGCQARKCILPAEYHYKLSIWYLRAS